MGAAFLVACQKIIDPTAYPSPTAVPSSTSTPVPTSTEQATTEPATPTPETKQLNTVYMTQTITAAALTKIFSKLDHKPSGKVAVKISSGEPGGHYFLAPELIAPLVKEVKGTIVECNTAYGGGRASTAAHEQVMKDHGFSAIAPVDIMDAEGTLDLPISGGRHLKQAVVGSHLANYDFVVDLAHFKGHAMAGFGGVIKNMSIGIASSKGKSLIHSAGTQTTGFGSNTPQDDFLESMAEAAKGVAEYFGDKILYINVMNNLSVDCDCDGSPAAPTMRDIGVLSSLDPVALDQACVDLVYQASDGKDLVKRMESRHGIHTLEHAEAIGLGTRTYELINLD